MRLKQYSYTPENQSDTTVAAAQKPTDTTALTLTTTSFAFARILKVTTDADDHTKTLAVVGTDADGNSISETITCGNATSVVSTKAYKTITSITPSGAFTGNVSVGDTNSTLVGYGSVIPLSYMDRATTAVALEITGTANVTVQETFDDILSLGTANAVFHDLPSGLAAKTSSTAAQLDRGVTGIRLKMASYSNGAVVKVQVNPSENMEGCLE